MSKSITSWPKTLARPSEREDSIVRIEKVVDLPAPFGPKRPRTSFYLIPKVLPLMAVGPLGYCLHKLIALT